VKNGSKLHKRLRSPHRSRRPDVAEVSTVNTLSFWGITMGRLWVPSWFADLIERDVATTTFCYFGYPLGAQVE